MIQTQNQKILMVTPPGAIVDNAALNTTSIDTKGWDYLDIYVILGATDVAMAVLHLNESDTDSNYVAIAGADFSATGTHLPSATDDDTIASFHVNLLGRMRFIDVAATGGYGTAGAYITIIAILSRAKESPDTAAKRGLAQEIFV